MPIYSYRLKVPLTQSPILTRLTVTLAIEHIFILLDSSYNLEPISNSIGSVFKIELIFRLKVPLTFSRPHVA